MEQFIVRDLLILAAMVLVIAFAVFLIVYLRSRTAQETGSFWKRVRSIFSAPLRKYRKSTNRLARSVRKAATGSHTRYPSGREAYPEVVAISLNPTDYQELQESLGIEKLEEDLANEIVREARKSKRQLTGGGVFVSIVADTDVAERRVPPAKKYNAQSFYGTAVGVGGQKFTPGHELETVAEPHVVVTEVLDDVGEGHTLPLPQPAPPRRVKVQLSVNGKKHQFTKEKVTIGRARGNDVVIAHSNASREHAVLEITESSIWLRDLKSMNGTFINGNPVPESGAAVSNGDIIRCGTESPEIVVTEVVRLSN